MNTERNETFTPEEKIEKETVSVITCDMEGRIETFDKGAEQVFGYSADEVIGKKRVSAFSPGKVVLGHINTWLKTAREKAEFETDTTFVRKDGNLVSAHIRITPTFKTIDGVKTQIGYCGKTHVLKEKDPSETMPRDPWWLGLLSFLGITRLPFLSATWIPVILATVWAFNGGIPNAETFDWPLFGLVFMGASFLHLAANTFNDYFDWRAGTDQANNDYFLQYSGGSRAIELGIITEKGLFRLASTFIGLAAMCGIVVMLGPWTSRFDLLYYAAAGGLGGFFYTAPPVKLIARRGPGELLIGLLFGPVLTMGTVYALTGIHALNAFLVGIPVGLLTLAILWVNEFPDVPSDLATGKVHLVAALGTRTARWGYLLLMMFSFATTAMLYQRGVVNQGALLHLVALPFAAYLSFKVFKDFNKRELATTCANTVYFHMSAGLLLILGISFL